MRSFTKRYFVISTSIVLIVLLLAVFDCVIYGVTGSFCVLPALNTLRFESIEDAWSYVEKLPYWGEGHFFQTYAVPFAFTFGITNGLLACIAYRVHLFDSKRLLIVILITCCLAICLYIIYRVSIAGSVSEKYIRRMISI